MHHQLDTDYIEADARDIILHPQFDSPIDKRVVEEIFP